MRPIHRIRRNQSNCNETGRKLKIKRHFGAPYLLSPEPHRGLGDSPGKRPFLAVSGPVARLRGRWLM